LPALEATVDRHNRRRTVAGQGLKRRKRKRRRGF
jgi:hypothetical protein